VKTRIKLIYRPTELASYSGDNWRYNYNKRSRAQFNINQSFREYGSLSLSAYQQDYWNENGYERSLSASYNLSYDGIAYGLNYTYSQTPGSNANDQQLAFNVQVPLSKWLPNSWETMALVRAPGAAGAKVQNNTGVRTDWRGYAVVPYVSTYRKNRIALETETLDDSVDLDSNTQMVTPTQGALVLADFKTRLGNRVLMTLSYQGKPVPFGAIAEIQQQAGEQENSGIVGPDGQLYLSGVPEQGQLHVKWGNAANQQCQVTFRLPSAAADSPVLSISAECR